MAKYGVRVPPGIACHTPDEVAAAAAKLSGASGEVVVKSQVGEARIRDGGPIGLAENGQSYVRLQKFQFSQISIPLSAQVLAGGRGLGTFTSGLVGGVHIVPVSEARGLSEKMLGQTLVTKQTGAGGKPVNALLVAEKLNLVNEMYFAILLDRQSAGPMIIACSEGGTSIEDLAETHPEKIIKMKIDLDKGLTKKQALELASGLQVSGSLDDAAEQLTALYEVFSKTDCTMLEVNPLAETGTHLLYAADAKLNFDDNAEYRQKELFALRDHAQEDPREVAAGKFDLNYIGLDGNIGCMVNGAGLAMATMDIISLHGASPANFLDVGGNASEEQVVEAFKILTADPKVKALLVNIFGGTGFGVSLIKTRFDAPRS